MGPRDDLAVRRALAALAPVHRQVVVARLEGVPYAVIGRDLPRRFPHVFQRRRLPASTVRRIERNALAQLRSPATRVAVCRALEGLDRERSE